MCLDLTPVDPTPCTTPLFDVSGGNFAPFGDVEGDFATHLYEEKLFIANFADEEIKCIDVEATIGKVVVSSYLSIPISILVLLLASGIAINCGSWPSGGVVIGDEGFGGVSHVWCGICV